VSLVDLRVLVTALALALALVVAGAIGWRQRSGTLILALLSVVWLTVDADFEGPHLIRFDAHHSLVLADLVGIAGLVVALIEWVLGRSPARHKDDISRF
jgi:hypothetical protein